MADSANTFKSFLPSLKNTYADKISKLSEKPNSSREYFSHIKKYLKKARKLQSTQK